MVFNVLFSVLFLHEKNRKKEILEGCSSAVIHLLDSEGSRFTEKEVDYLISIMRSCGMTDTESQMIFYRIEIDFPNVTDFVSDQNVEFINSMGRGEK